MTNYALLAKLQCMLDKGMTRAQIARAIGITKQNVGRLVGTACDAERWESEMKRHAEFFKGLSPREEYTKHAELRKTIDEF